jgi:hypothetical protein
MSVGNTLLRRGLEQIPSTNIDFQEAMACNRPTSLAHRTGIHRTDSAEAGDHQRGAVGEGPAGIEAVCGRRSRWSPGRIRDLAGLGRTAECSATPEQKLEHLFLELLDPAALSFPNRSLSLLLPRTEGIAEKSPLFQCGRSSSCATCRPTSGLNCVIVTEAPTSSARFMSSFGVW